MHTAHHQLVRFPRKNRCFRRGPQFKQGKPQRWFVGVTAATVTAVWSPSLLAYPTSIIFAPTGESLALGEGAANAYVPLNLRPSVGPSASWVGLNYGIAPVAQYGSGLSFGGVELGIDLINGASHPNGESYAKAVFNAKVSVLAQTGRIPAIGLGLMSFAPFQHKESVNLTYFAATKELALGGPSYGTLTLGLGYAAFATAYAFQGAPPFRDTKLALLAGYVTPDWKGFSLSLDTLGGISETSSSNVALSFASSDNSYLMVGAYFTNDRTLPKASLYDGVFASIGVTIPSPQASPVQ